MNFQINVFELSVFPIFLTTHTQKFYHRDLKVENMLLDSSMDIKIIGKQTWNLPQSTSG